MPSKKNREILFEFQRVGQALRITAIDAQSGTEVVMVGDPRYSQEMLKRMAVRKLEYVLSKK
ncbi:DUF6898 family protein [Varunaivibrio sulfuroxidans]|uniref:DUF6898 family protein n=1 Tax=Varunaivibrio sulfuroxidans TaxID=1773489 RepID=UPI0010509359